MYAYTTPSVTTYDDDDDDTEEEEGLGGWNGPPILHLLYLLKYVLNLSQAHSAHSYT